VLGCYKYVEFINKIELYEPLYVLLVWVTVFVFEFHTTIFDIVEVEFGKMVGS
jgi:hypothetical protein